MYSILLSNKMSENIDIFGSSGNCVEASYRSEFLPRDRGGKVGVKEKATHPPFVPPIEGGEADLYIYRKA